MRIAVFTAGSATPERLALLKRLVQDPEMEIAGVFVDQYSLKSFKRVKFLFKKWGATDFALSFFVVALEKLAQLRVKLFYIWHDLFLKAKPLPSYAAFCAEHGIALHRVADINSKAAMEPVRATQADLGMILGGRILAQKICSIPRLGTLNMHGHDVHKYRGGAQIGYPERLNNESKLGVTIHFASAKVDEGDVIGYRELEIEKYDTDQSLELKMRMMGAELYYQSIKALSQGAVTRSKQDLSKGQTYYSTPHWRRAKLWNPIRRQLWRQLKKENPRQINRSAQAIFAQFRRAYFFLMLPWLSAKRRKMEQQGRAPIIIVYYHGVGNGAENWMTLPLETLWEHHSYARRYYEVISLSQAVGRLKSGRNDKTAIVFTYDDGYRSISKNLLPLCQIHDLPAAVFVCAERSRSGARLDHDLTKGYQNAELMSPFEVKACANGGFEIGSHSLNHEIMSRLNDAEAAHVFSESRRLLKEMSGQSIPYFSFPVGNTDCISEANLRAGAQHYEALFSAYGGYNFPGDKNGFYFQRFSNPMDLPAFRALCAGVHRFRPFYVNHSSRPDLRGSTPEALRPASHG